MSYDGTQVQIEWKAAAACPLQGDHKPKDDPNDDGSKIPNDGNGHESTDSGLGWFFLMYAQPSSHVFCMLTRWYSSRQACVCLCCVLRIRGLLQLLEIWCSWCGPYPVSLYSTKDFYPDEN